MWSEKLFLPSGFNPAAVPPGVRALNVGCGNRKMANAVNLDILACMDADVRHDLNAYPWPFAENEFDLLLAENILEHLQDPVRAMEELHRIAKPGAAVVIRVPYFRHKDAFTDPQHIRFFTSESMDFYVRGRHHFAKGYSKAVFSETGFWLSWPHRHGKGLSGMALDLARRHVKRYEQHLAAVFPVKFLLWELRAEK